MASPERTASRTHTAELLARYDVPAPRYTSYPTAVDFGPLTPETYRRRLQAADARPADDPLALYLHLPFCEKRCRFCGCHVIISPHKEKASPYLDLLRAEANLVLDQLPNRRRVNQIHLGGGTPTYFTPAQLAGLMEHLLARIQPTRDAELSLEVDPRVTTFQHLEVLRGFGFNRLSLGVQDFTPEVQEAVGRVQSVEQTQALITHARELGYRGINLDLIYGLPYQTEETFDACLDQVLALDPDRVAVYSFAFVPWMKAHMRTLPAEAFPSREVKFALLGVARERFLQAGYADIGMDHFAKPQDELSRAAGAGRLHRNFMGYCVRPASDLIGLGISAIGDVDGALVQNVKKLSEYKDAITRGALPVERGWERSPEDRLRGSVIQELMCNGGLDLERFRDRTGLDFHRTFAEELSALRPHVENGLVTIAQDRIQATETGRLFVRNLATCFDAYRATPSGGATQVFSRGV